ncbi:hypothetical protein C8R44DRAFT_117718 [Mycena epipterygia]|nr:hypothetical protein C8R44DRAFT_117718 [Mycena epipterygia]
MEAWNSAYAWLQNPASTYREALDLCAPVPPVNREGESCTTATKALTNKERTTTQLRRIIPDDDWVDRCVADLAPRFQQTYPTTERLDLFPCFLKRHEAQPAETDERVTDHFHLSHILEPAALIAGSCLKEKLVAKFAPRHTSDEGSTTGDLQITNKAGDTCYLTVEDKRGRVFDAHSHLLRQHVDSTFPWPRSANENPGEAVRIWMQLWTQTFVYRTLYGKLFSILGTMYVYRKPGDDNLYCSKIYDNPENDVLRTTAIILVSKETPPQPTSMAARLMASMEARPILRSFTSWLAEKVPFFLSNVTVSQNIHSVGS